MEEFKICVCKRYWKYVKVKAESYKEARILALKNCDEPPKYFDDWTKNDLSILRVRTENQTQRVLYDYRAAILSNGKDHKSPTEVYPDELCNLS